LPDDAATDGVNHSVLSDRTINIISWDKVIPPTDERALLTEFDQGRLTIPLESPIAGGESITGLAFGPLIIQEEQQKAPITGGGLLYRRGIASDAPFSALRKFLEESLKPGTAPMTLRSIAAKINEISGIVGIFKHRRPIGLVDYFYRTDVTTGVDGSLFEIEPEKPDFRTKAPMLRVHVRRHAAPLNQKFKLQISLANYDEMLCSVLREIEAGISEIIVSAPAHITDVSLSVFDNSGSLVDQLNGKFNQGIHFGLTAMGAVDTLPPPFPGSPRSPDLEARPRIHTIAFQGPSIANRSGGLDVLRMQEAKLSAVIGPRSAEFENMWFERGLESQVEVIRWIKTKMERPGVKKAYLFDPYLGSDALKRVIARQGNETAELFIVVSPGDIDPDADITETSAASDYLGKLVATATEWASKLAGRISVVHIKRGNGSRQAFHDRYLCMVDQEGIPTTYLLSNSLSKAAGDWPFVACELDRVMSWRVYVYIQELILGHAKDSDLQPEVIWKSADRPVAAQSGASAASPPPEPQPRWVGWANAFLTDIWNIIVRNAEFKSQVGAHLDALLHTWPAGVDTDKLAESLFRVVSHRDAIVVFVSDRLREGGRAELANILDDKLLARFLDLLPQSDHKGGWFVPFDVRCVVLENLGRTIARKKDPTNFIRGKINPRVHKYVTMIETQRLDPTVAWAAHEASVFLSIIALRVAIDAEGTPSRFRIGVATDYIHWLGRLMRSDVAASVYVGRDPVPPEWLNDVNFAAKQIANARRVLGEELEAPIDRVNRDLWVAQIFKRSISVFASGPEGAAPSH
jgi:hypothetical protein